MNAETEHEQRLRAMLRELADATPVRPRRAADLVAESRLLTPLEHRHPSRWPWLAAAAAVVLAMVVAVPLLTARDSADPFASDLSDVPAVDTSALAGGRMAFVRENDLFVADGATGEVRRITDTGRGEEVSHVSWSHDGEWLAFAVHDESGLWVVRRDGSERHRLGRSPSSYAWSPTANELVYATGDEVRLAQVDGSSRALESGPDPAPHTTVVWSPDGASVAFAAAGDELALAAVDDPAADVVWNLVGSPPVGQVLAWPADDLVLVAGPDRDDVEILGFHPSNGGVQGLATFPGPFDATSGLAVSTDGLTLVVAAPLGHPFACRISGPAGASTANCGMPLDLPDGSTAPALSPSPASGDLSVVVVTPAGELQVENRFATDAGSVMSLGLVDDATRGMIEIDGVGYGVVPEPPVWIDEDALIVRVDERDLVRIDVETGERTVVVAGARFLPPADDYPGGFGFAYWRP